MLKSVCSINRQNVAMLECNWVRRSSMCQLWNDRVAKMLKIV